MTSGIVTYRDRRAQDPAIGRLISARVQTTKKRLCHVSLSVSGNAIKGTEGRTAACRPRYSTSLLSKSTITPLGPCSPDAATFGLRACAALI